MAATKYIIEELYTQDAKGAVFHATTAENGEDVWLSRFFPYGDGERGLEPDDLQRFQTTVTFMQFWQHHSLQKILDGGCDLIDQMPYIVCEKGSGQTLAGLLASGVLSMEQGRQLAEQALVLILELDKIFSGQAQWLSLAPESVEVFDDGMRYRFAIDPVSLVANKRGATAAREISSLVETAMGWTGRVVTGSTMGSLSGWVRQARTKDYSAAEALALLQGQNPHQAGLVAATNESALPQESQSTPLQAVTGSTTPTGRLATSTGNLFSHTQPQVPLASLSKRSPLPWVIAGIFAVLSVAVFVFIQSSNTEQQALSEKSITEPKPSAALPAPTTLIAPEVKPSPDLAQAKPDEKLQAAQPQQVPLPSASIEPKVETKPLTSEEQRRADIANKTTKMLADLALADQQKQQAVNRPKTPKRAGDYKPEEIQLVGEQLNEIVSLAGKVTIVKSSKSSKTHYVRFGDDIGLVLGRYQINQNDARMNLQNLQQFVGKNVRLKGKVVKDPITKGKFRFAIDLTKFEDIEVIP